MWKLLGGLLTSGLVLVWGSMAQADDTANAIIQNAIKAHGGAANLAKLTVRHEISKVTRESGTQFTNTRVAWVHLPDRIKTTSEGEFKGQPYKSISVIDGDKSWSSTNGRTKEYTEEQLKELKDRLHEDNVLTLVPLLTDKGLNLSPLGEVKVSDRPALGVKVSAKDHLDIDLYFDKETALLVKSGRGNWEHLYSNYKKTDGLNWAMKMVDYNREDGKQVRATEITELRFLDKIDDSEFTKP
ncbi:MAG: hypothetical protein HY290_10255 [Planctomycetia bacterium]|nr:hypothetical protein [Planctomycetia bacterium]